MFYYAIKILVSVVIILAVVEIAKRSSVVGAVLVSIPVISVLSITWLYMDTGDIVKVETLTRNIFWMLIPSLVLFICLPWLLHAGVNFWVSLGVSVITTGLAYGIALWVMTVVSGK